MADKLRFDVEVNTRDGVRELDRLGDAGKQAGEDIESGMDDAASATDLVIAAMRTMTTQIDAELRETAAAADALKLALGETAERIDATEAVNEFKKMGLSADQVRADVDKLALALKEADDVDMRRMGDGIDSAGVSLDRMRGSADQSRSVLANMAGNAAQDMGALGGVAGTAGVAIGQLAEYATEGNIKLSSLAGVAGPMLGLAAASMLVQQIMGNIAKTKAFNTKEAQSYADAIETAGAGIAAVNQKLRETETITGLIEDNNPFTFFTDEETDITGKLQQYGLTLQQVNAVIADTGEEQDNWRGELDGTTVVLDDITPAMESFIDAMNAANVPMNEQMDIIRVLQQNQQNYRDGVEQTGIANQFYASSLEDVNAAMFGNERAARSQAATWRTLLQDLQDGNIDTAAATTAWNTLREALDLTDVEMAKLVDEKLDEQLEKDTAAAEGLAQAVRDTAVELDAMADNAAEADTIMSGADWGRAALDGATEAFSTYFTDVSGFGQQIADQEEAWDNLATTIEDAGTAVLDLQSPEGRQVWDALQQLGTSIVPELAEAWVAADGDMNHFRQSAEIISRRTLARLTQALIDSGVEAEDAAVLAQQYIDVLGLTPEDVETQIKLAGDAEARIKLGLLQGVIDDLPEEVQTEIAMAILADDPQAALDAAQRAIEQNADLHATMVVDADVSQALNAIGNVIRAIQNARILGGILSGMQASASSAPGGTMAPVGATTVYVNVPRGTRPDDMVRAADRYARRNGMAHASRR